MKSGSPLASILAIVITILALADGVLHFALDIILFRGNFLGRLGPPPGAPATPAPAAPPRPPLPVPIPLPLNQMFVLNIVGYVILVAAFWLSPRLLGRSRWLVNIVMIVYAAAILLAWLEIGGPNPRGLGYLSKSIEILLIVALIAHSWIVSKTADIGVQVMRRGA